MLLVLGAGCSAEPDRQVRKYVHELTLADLERCPVWEFALDELGETVGGHSVDEETVKPRPELEEVSPADGIFVVRTRFTTADGSTFYGYSTPREVPDLARTQPVIISKTRGIAFWYGGVAPTDEDVQESYRALGKTSDGLFPLKYQMLVSVENSVSGREIKAFLYLGEDFETVLERR